MAKENTFLNESNKTIIDKINRCNELFIKTGQGSEKCLDFDLPKMVVIGSQSSGKSSILEGIVGKEFLPRGTEMVTRCPLVLQLHNIPDGEEYAVFAADGVHQEKRFTDFSILKDEIESRTNNLAPGKTVSDHEIVLKIFSPFVFDLQLVDLPGYIMNLLPGQPDSLAEDIERLARKYISSENTLILAISTATDDIANSVAIKNAKKVDRDGSRTIGIITKVDAVQDPEAIASLIKILENKTLPIERGYIGVINKSKSQTENGTSMAEVRAYEDNYFKIGDFASISKRMGTRYLQRYLNSELAKYIGAKIPGITQSAVQKLNNIEEDLRSLGYHNDKKKPNSDPRAAATEIISSYCFAVKEAMLGNNVNVDLYDINAGAAMNQASKAGIVYACEMAMSVDKREIEKKAEFILTNMCGAYDAALLSPLTFSALVKDLADQFKTPLHHFVKNLTDVLKTHLENLAHKEFSILENLKAQVLKVVLEEVKQYSQDCLKDMELQIEVQKMYVNLTHPDFALNKKMLEGSPAPEEGVKPTGSNTNLAVPETDFKGSSESLATSASQMGKEEYNSKFGSTTTLHPSKREKWGWKKSSLPAKKNEEFTTINHNGFGFDENDDSSSSGTFSDRQSIHSIIKGDTKIVNILNAPNPPLCLIKIPTDLKGKVKYFLALVFDYMLIVEKCLNDMAQRMVFYHLVHKVCEFHRTGQIQVQIYQMQKASNQDETLFYKKLLEKSSNSGREMAIMKLLQEQDWIKQTIDILNEK